MKDNQTTEFNTLEDVADAILSDERQQKTVVNVLYALNGTGKTRLSRCIAESNEEACLCFNALFQDYFTWDNENCILIIDSTSWIVECINEQGLQKSIVENFLGFCNNNAIYPQFSADSDEVIFSFKDVTSGASPIKISKAEETIFVWSVFYTLLQTAVAELQIENLDDRSTDYFNRLSRIIIDDPVSSVDDTSIIKISLAVLKLLKEFTKIENNTQAIEWLVCTHHALFFNEICNLVGRGDKKLKLNPYILSTTKEQKYCLQNNTKKTFAYHMLLRQKIENAISREEIEKEHFNMFRILLEKTQLYFGYKSFENCLPDFDERKEVIILCNKYSHFSEFEYYEPTNREKGIFAKAFESYNRKYQAEEK